MATRNIIVLPYDEKWKQAFTDIKSELDAALGGIAVSVEHVGSTSVPGLSAKPIIDIDVVVHRTDMATAIKALATIGYEHEGNGGDGYINHKGTVIEKIYRELGLISAGGS